MASDRNHGQREEGPHPVSNCQILMADLGDHHHHHQPTLTVPARG